MGLSTFFNEKPRGHPILRCLKNQKTKNEKKSKLTGQNYSQSNLIQTSLLTYPIQSKPPLTPY